MRYIDAVHRGWRRLVWVQTVNHPCWNPARNPFFNLRKRAQCPPYAGNGDVLEHPHAR